MSWFGNEDKTKEMPESAPSLLQLPRLPELPALPSMREPSNEPLPQLPSYPSGATGDKFSQNSIKHAVSGEKEGDKAEANEPEVETQEMPEPQSNYREYDEIPEGYHVIEENTKTQRATKGDEPVFIRLDKFEDAMKVFDDTKHKINEIEKLLADTKKIKDAEEAELESWENEIRKIKSQIEKIDKDVFSKIE